MMIKINILILLVIINLKSHAQTFDWLQSATYSSETQGDWVGIDIAGNLYVAGTCFNSDHGSVANRANAFLSKYSPDGNLIWTDTLIGVKTIKCDIDSNGNVYATGKFLNTATFNGQTLISSSQYNTGYLVKYNANGNCVFARNLSFVCPKNISIIATGGYFLTGIMGYGVSITYDNVTFDKWGFFLAKFNEMDSCIWGVQTDGVNYSYGEKFSIDKFGSCYITGEYRNSTTFYSYSDSINHVNLSGQFHNSFLCKYSQNGVLLWAKSFEGHPLAGLNLTIDDTGNLIYICRNFSENASIGGFTLNNNAEVTLNYDSLGNLRRYTTIEIAQNIFFQSSDLIYSNGYIYKTGAFNNTIDFGGQTIALGSNKNQLFIAKYDTAFNLQWVKNSVGLIGLSGYQDGTARATSLFVRGNTIGITGSVSEKVDFGGLIFNGHNYPEMFVLKISDTTTVTNISNIFSSQNKFSVYPNPNHGIFRLDLSTEKREKLLLTIIDAKGQQVYTETISDFQGELKKEIDLSRNAKGIYFMQILNGEGTRTKKIVLE